MINKLYWPWIGGLETIVQQIAEGLNGREDIGIEVLCCRPKGERIVEEVNAIKVTRASSLGIFWGMPLSLDFFLLFKKVRKNFDIIDLHHPFPLADLAIFLFRPKANLVVHYHSDIVRQRILEFLFRPLILNTLKKATKIIISNPNLIKTSPYLKRFRHKCLVVPFGIDISRFQQPAWPPPASPPTPLSVSPHPSVPHPSSTPPPPTSQLFPPPCLPLFPLPSASFDFSPSQRAWDGREGRGGREEGGGEGLWPGRIKEREAQKLKEKYGDFVLFVGRLNYYKGLRYLIEAMRDIPANLVIIGEGPEKKNLELKIKKLGLKDKIFFLPHLEEKRLINFYQAARVFVLPSIFRSEAFGLVLLEAMACGTPVISTELGTGTSWVNIDGQTGFVVPPRDSPALARAIKKILENKTLAQRFGQNAKERVEREFSLKKMLETVAGVYQSI